MNATVGVAQLRQNLSTYLRRVEKGERLTVTDRNKPIAELGPPAVGRSLSTRWSPLASWLHLAVADYRKRCP